MIHFIIRNYNDNERSLKLYKELSSQNKGGCDISIYDDFSQEELPRDVNVIRNQYNQGELRFYSNIRSHITRPYVVFMDSDDLIAPDLISTYLDKIPKLNESKAVKLDVRLKVQSPKYDNDYSFTHINSMAYSLFNSQLYKKLTTPLSEIIQKFEKVLGYNLINLQADSYCNFLLNYNALRSLLTYNIVTNSCPVTYVIPENPDPYKYIDRARFIDERYPNIYDNPKLKDRSKQFRKLVLECVKD